MITLGKSTFRFSLCTLNKVLMLSDVVWLDHFKAKVEGQI